MSQVFRYLVLRCVDHNSLYLISAFCMLLGCYMVTGDTQSGTRQLGTDLGLLGLFKVYELIAVVAACVVFRTLRVVNDGILLGCVSLVLVLDPTLFNNGFYGIGRSTGLLVNGVVLLWALVHLGLLHTTSGLPVSRRAVGAFALAATAIHLGPAAFDVSRTGQVAVLFALAWVPLLVVMVGRTWRELPEAPGTGSEYWIYFRYLDAVLVVYPVLAVTRHLWSMAGVYETSLVPAILAPLALAAGMLAIRLAGPESEGARTAHASATWTALALALVPEPGLAWTAAGLEISPVRLVAFVGLTMSFLLHLRTGSRAAAVNGVLLATVCAAGSTGPEIARSLGNLDGWTLLPAVLAALHLAHRRRTFGTACAAAVAISALLIQHVPLAAGVRSFAFVQLAGHAILFLAACHPMSPWVDRTGRIGLGLAGLTFLATCAPAPGSGSGPAVTGFLYLQLAGYMALGRIRGDRALARAGMEVAGLHLVVQSLASLRRVDAVLLARTYGGAALIASSFLTLFAGLWVSFNKTRLRRMVTPVGGAPAGA